MCPSTHQRPLLISHHIIQPSSPHKGVLTTSDLKIRFAVVRGEVRHETFVPEGANHIIGQAVGYTIANFVSAPR